MAKNQNVIIKYLAFNQAHEEIFDKNTPIFDIMNYLRGVCNTYVITDIQPTSRIKVEINLD